MPFLILNDTSTVCYLICNLTVLVSCLVQYVLYILMANYCIQPNVFISCFLTFFIHLSKMIFCLVSALHTSFSVTRSEMSTLHSYGSVSLAGSILTTATFLPIPVKNCNIPEQYVVFPDPGGPITTWPNAGGFLSISVNLASKMFSRVWNNKKKFVG